MPQHTTLHDQRYVPVRCAEDDPNRCQSYAGSGGGQCPFLAIPGGPTCPLHGNHTVVHEETTGLYNFKRTEVLHRLSQFKKHPDANRLTTELGVLRLTLEELINRCDTNYDLIAASGQMTILIQNIERLLISNRKIEKQMSELLTLEQVVMMAQAFFNIVIACFAETSQSFESHYADTYGGKDKELATWLRDQIPFIVEEIAAKFETVMVNPPSPTD